MHILGIFQAFENNKLPPIAICPGVNLIANLVILACSGALICAGVCSVLFQSCVVRVSSAEH